MDARIAIEVDKYPNWQNIAVFGLPLDEGRAVTQNTYERFAWATVGITNLLPNNLLGVGVLKEPFKLLLVDSYSNLGDVGSTHSGWLEIGLAFGIPGLLLFLGSILISGVYAFSTAGVYKWLPFSLALSLILVYTVGELSSQHSIEILCFGIATLSALVLPSESIIQIN